MAYAAVVSLKQTIDRLQNPSQSRILLPNSEIDFLYSDIRYLQSFLEQTSSWQSRKRVDALQMQIKDFVQQIEDLIESHVSDRLLSASADESSRDHAISWTSAAFSQQLLKVKQELTSCLLMGKREYYNSTDEEQQPSNSFTADSDSGGKHQIVGFDDQLKKLKDLVVQTRPAQVIPIIGMAGIGKTTLAKEVYYDPFIIQHFKFRLFLPIGPQYHLRKTLLLALNQLGVPTDEMHEKMDTEILGKYIYNRLFGWNYLVVLDDVWSIQVWDELKRYFPVHFIRQHIIVTSRLREIIDNLYSVTQDIIHVPFLTDDQSWNLLRQTVFTSAEEEERYCDLQLEKIGKKIAEKCEGLPLAIVEVGKLLRETEKTVENWKKVEEDENMLDININDETPFSRTISLSYTMLPQHLKACFLYMGVLPKDYEISFSKTINLWFSEGIVEPQRSKSLEETAEECLEDLVSRNVLIVGKTRSTGGTKTCRMHFVFRDLSVTEARNQKFFHVIKKYANTYTEEMNGQRRLCIHNNIVLGIKQVHSWMMESVPSARSLLCLGEQHQYPLPLYLGLRLLRVLDALTIRFYEFPNQVLELFHLRYLAITYDGQIPSSICRLHNLEVLIVRQHQRIKFSDATPVYLPIEIWKLQQLRHLQCMGIDLPDPSGIVDDSVILEKLLTLSGVSAHSCNPRVLARTPNLTKLGIQIESAHNAPVETFSFFCDHFIDVLHHIESLKCVLTRPDMGCQVLHSIPSFSVNLRKISLSGCGFSWECMSVIGALPKLEALKLRCHAFRGPEWKLCFPEFIELKFLLLEDLDIEHWTFVDSFRFVSLEGLIIRHCYNLRGIPPEFLVIPTLEMIEVVDCSPSVVDLVREIIEEELIPSFQGDYGRFQIHSSWDDDHKKLKS